MTEHERDRAAPAKEKAATEREERAQLQREFERNLITQPEHAAAQERPIDTTGTNEPHIRWAPTSGETARTSATAAPNSSAALTEEAATPSAPQVRVASGTHQPTLDEIVSAVSLYFHVSHETAYAWIIGAIAQDRKAA